MQAVQLFDTVSVSYTASLPTGDIIDRVPDTEPITLVIGSGRIRNVPIPCTGNWA